MALGWSCALLPAFAADPLLERARLHFDPLPDHPPDRPANPVTPEKVRLGKTLFFDPRISRSQAVSCHTCHNLSLWGVDRQETSIGHAWQRGPRNAPTVLNAVFNLAQFWDGRARDLAEQAGVPIQSPLEMAASKAYVVQVLSSMPGYLRLFREAFPGEADPVTFRNATLAIEAFEATLLTPGAPFDRFLQGDPDALTPEQRKGLALFMDKGCAACHMSLNVGGNGYYQFGVADAPPAGVCPSTDPGREAVVETITCEFVFKAPSLRNVAMTPPYFHSGKVWDLHTAVAIMGSAQLGLRLAPGEVTLVTRFLESLTGRPPVVTLPELPPATDRTPPPAP
nr:cytochrome-c peroxidase [Dissulfurirhabdus thermomarina]